MLKAYGRSSFLAGVGALATVASNVVLARMMGPSNFGFVGLTLMVVLFLVTVGNCGLIETGANFIAREIGKENYFQCRYISRTVIIFLSLSSIFLIIIIFVYSHKLDQWMASERISEGLLYLSPFIPAIMMFQWSLMVLKGVGHSTSSLLLESLLLQVKISTLSVVVWFITENAFFVILAQGTAYLLTALVGVVLSILALRELPKSDKSPSERRHLLFAQGIPLILIGLGNRLQRRGDSVIIGSTLGDFSVGLYRAAYTLASCTRPLRKVSITFAIHHLARTYGMKRNDLLKSHYDIALRVGLLLTLPFTFIIIAFADELIILLYGESYGGVPRVIQFLAVGQVVLVAGGPIQTLYSAMKANWLRMRISILSAVLTLILQISLIRYFGIEGIAFATCLGFTILLLSLVFCAHINFSSFEFHNINALASVIITVVLAFLIDTVNLNLILKVCISAIIALIIFRHEIRTVTNLAIKITEQEK